MFSCYVFCVCFACIIAESWSIRLYLHIRHKQTFDELKENVESQEVIDTGDYELRRRRRSLDDPQFVPVSADEERAEAQQRPSVAQFRKVVGDAGLVGGWSVEDEEDRLQEEEETEEEEEVWKSKRFDKKEQLERKMQKEKDKEEREMQKELDKNAPKKNGRMWALGQLVSGLIFGKRVAQASPGSYAKFASRYGMFLFMPIMIIITVLHILLWYIWFTRKSQQSRRR